MIRIDLQEQSMSAGDELTGVVIYRTDKPTEIKEAEITLGWYTEGRGSTDRQTVQSHRLDTQQLLSGIPIPFRFRLPDDGPITYNGALMRIIWELQAVVKKPGLLSQKEKANRGFLVLPR